MVVVVVAGVGLGLQARINGALATSLSSPSKAALVNFSTGLTVVGLARLIKGDRLSLTVAKTRPWHWIGGLLGACFVYTAVLIAPRIGVAHLSVGVAAGAVTTSLIADMTGMSAAGRHAFSARRVAGGALAILAVVTVSTATDTDAQNRFMALAVLGGIALGFQHPINGRLAAGLGDPLAAAIVSFGVGMLAMTALAGSNWHSKPWPDNSILYAGGLFAALYVLIAIRVVGRIGALRLSVATVTGQLIGGTLIDIARPIGDVDLGARGLAGVLIALLATVLTTTGTTEGAEGGTPG